VLYFEGGGVALTQRENFFCYIYLFNIILSIYFICFLLPFLMHVLRFLTSSLSSLPLPLIFYLFMFASFPSLNILFIYVCFLPLLLISYLFIFVTIPFSEYLIYSSLLPSPSLNILFIYVCFLPLL